MEISQEDQRGVCRKGRAGMVRQSQDCEGCEICSVAIQAGAGNTVGRRGVKRARDQVGEGVGGDEEETGQAKGGDDGADKARAARKRRRAEGDGAGAAQLKGFQGKEYG